MKRIERSVVDYRDVPMGKAFNPEGNDVAEDLLWWFADNINERYYELLNTDEERERFETTGELLIRRGGSTEAVFFKGFTLRDVPDILTTLVEMEAQQKEVQRKEAECKAEERKRVNRIRAKERRQLKKLGEWSGT